MTNEEKDIRRAQKDKAVAWFRRQNLAEYNLKALDVRLHQYISEIAKNPHRHNLFEVLVAKRFLVILKKKVRDHCLNVGLFLAYNAFYESLWLDGPDGLRHYRCTPVQIFINANIYLFSNPDGTRMVREVCLFVPRKYGKTTESAGRLLWEFEHGDDNAECYIGANSADQAQKCMSVVRRHLNKIGNGKAYKVNIDGAWHVLKDRNSSIQALTANANTKDGLNAAAFVMDEFSQSRDNDLYTTLITSMATRKQPLVVIITTASDVIDGPFYAMLQGYEKMLLGELPDDWSVFPMLFMPDVDDAEDSPQTWMKVQPHWGITVQEGFYQAQYAAAVRGGAEALLAFRTKLLNKFCLNEAEAWIPYELAREHSKRLKLEDIAQLTGTQRPLATLAFDMSVRNDFTAISLCIFDPRRWVTEDGEQRRGRFYFYAEAWLPEESLQFSPNRMIYRKWIADKYLFTCPGKVIDDRFIADRIFQLASYVDLRAVGFDPYKSEDVKNRVMATDPSFDGVMPVRQTYGEFTAPVMSYKSHIVQGDITLFYSPLVCWAHGNAVLDEDKLGNAKPIKRSQDEKIDPVITNLMAYDLAMKYEK